VEFKEIVMDSSVTAYTDSYIVSHTGYVHYLSLWGQPQQVQAIYAGLKSGSWHWIGVEGRLGGLFGLNISTSRNKRLGDVLHKIAWAVPYFSPKIVGIREKVVYGNNKDEIVEAAFRLVSAMVSTPMKPEWKYWLWEEILEPYVTQLETFGHIQVAYEIYIPCESELERKIIGNLDYLDKAA